MTGWLLGHIPTSFLLGAIAGPLAMFAFQWIKKLGGWIDSQPAWAKNAWMFVLTQVVAVIATITQQDVSCTVEMTAAACLGQLTPSVIKGLIIQGGAWISFKLKKMQPA